MARGPKKPTEFVVRMVLPAGATKADARGYIEDAVRAWNGGYPPEEPFFNLDRDTVKVSHAKVSK